MHINTNKCIYNIHVYINSRVLVNDSRNKFFCRKLNETINQNKLDSEKKIVYFFSYEDYMFKK